MHAGRARHHTTKHCFSSLQRAGDRLISQIVNRAPALFNARAWDRLRRRRFGGVFPLQHARVGPALKSEKTFERKKAARKPERAGERCPSSSTQAERFGGYLCPPRAKKVEDGRRQSPAKAEFTDCPRPRTSAPHSPFRTREQAPSSASTALNRLSTWFILGFLTTTPKGRCPKDAGERGRRLGKPQAARVPRPSGNRFPRLRTQRNSSFRPMAA